MELLKKVNEKCDQKLHDNFINSTSLNAIKILRDHFESKCILCIIINSERYIL